MTDGALIQVDGRAALSVERRLVPEADPARLVDRRASREARTPSTRGVNDRPQ